MSHTARNYHVSQSFSRACLESSPASVQPRPFSAFGVMRSSDGRHSQLYQLKRKLLRAALEETPETGAFKRLCGAANQAAELAWATASPLLVFPCLFEEMVQTIRARFQQEQNQQPDAQSRRAPTRVEGQPSNGRSIPDWPEPASSAGLMFCLADFTGDAG